jgi:hypothetical protein
MLFALFFFPLLQFANKVSGATIGSVVFTVGGLAATMAVMVYMLFGTYIAHPEILGLAKDSSGVSLGWNILQTLLSDSIRDYMCGGSNIWVYISIHMLPNLIVLLKIITN